ncbi:Oidioi.mRNA.OKI2018_I69.XSR.g16555.t1.cds [Oikopleura dioica]|uniref:Oidioi.mRNA.OKI2018_I69.XSR.g16555.t1.cds n=1 Tax=Oikopleura dioica TaxID=34765 RepID=A0ABN7SGI1_OIKDI|nr:Oidioi.mRNA.OKI2018_I69.XSR.g16555.t1.cds [Oikopleura dioica]
MPRMMAMSKGVSTMIHNRSKDRKHIATRNRDPSTWVDDLINFFLENPDLPPDVPYVYPSKRNSELSTTLSES